MKRAMLLSLMCCAALDAATTYPRFYARQDYPSAPGYVGVADVNGDGIPDVISFSSTGIGLPDIVSPDGSGGVTGAANLTK